MELRVGQLLHMSLKIEDPGDVVYITYLNHGHYENSKTGLKKNEMMPFSSSTHLLGTLHQEERCIRFKSSEK